jgi:trimethylamine--corrinoid protein Co-methyltransferase
MLLLAGSAANVRAMTAMAAAAAGSTESGLAARPTLTFVVCPVSPLKLIREVCEVVLEAARKGMPLCVVSMVLAGMTGPVRLAGSVVLHNAEVLATLTLAQLARRGAPVIYGTCSTGADLRHGASSLGTPECGLMSAALAAVARRYRLPAWSVAGWGDAKTVDAQAGHEYTLSALLVALAGGGFIPGAGMFESGRSFDFAKLVMDAEFAALIKYTVAGVPVSDETLSLDIIDDVGPFGDFLSHDDTYRHMREQSQPTLIDRRVREEWTQAGATDISERARQRAREILETHVPTPLPDGAAAEMRAIVAAADREAGV